MPDRHHGPSNKGPSRPGELVNPAGHWALARIALDSWSNLRALGHGPESPGTAGIPPDPRTQARVARDSCLTPGPSGTVLSHPGPLVNTACHQTRRDSPRRAGKNHRPSDTGPSGTGQLVDPAEPLTQVQVTWDCWSTPGALGHKRECPGAAGRPLGTRRWAGVARDNLSALQALGPRC